MFRFFVPAAALVVAAGCGGRPSLPAPVGVRGAVTLDGQPLPDGVVEFAANDGTPPQQLKCQAGRFEGDVRPGKYAVRVKAYRPMKDPPKSTPGAPVDPTEQYLPARYNAKSELTADVMAGGPELKLDLKSGR